MPGFESTSQMAVGNLLNIVAWSGLALTISTVASSVIFGLRAEADKIRRLGQYTLEEKIGEGGMGIVYRARHALLRRPTAIKLLSPRVADADNVRRFEREVQLTATLTHPSTIAIYDYGRTPSGAFYYAMEYLDGLNLEQLVQCDGPQPAGRVIHILQQVSGALSEAHEVGLIHRDIKPANIILRRRGSMPDVAKVVDFGLVKPVVTQSSMTVALTAQNVILGTPLYMAPESIRGDTGVDGRSDLYALGAVAYYLLTGATLFESSSVMEVLAAHLHTSPPRPCERTTRQVPSDLEGVILRCLAKDPDDRFATARELTGALHSCAAATPWSLEAAEAWWGAFGIRRPRSPGDPQSPETSPTLELEIDIHDR
jgi:serine/threonine-protein kinase